MTSLKNYQYATAILGLLVIILGGLLIQTKMGTEVNENVDDAQAGLNDCSSKISDWKKTYTGKTTSTEAKDKLSDILSDCTASLQ